VVNKDLSAKGGKTNHACLAYRLPAGRQDRQVAGRDPPWAEKLKIIH